MKNGLYANIHAKQKRMVEFIKAGKKYGKNPLKGKLY